MSFFSNPIHFSGKRLYNAARLKESMHIHTLSHRTIGFDMTLCWLLYDFENFMLIALSRGHHLIEILDYFPKANYQQHHVRKIVTQYLAMFKTYQQQKLLEFLKFFHTSCQEHNVKFLLKNVEHLETFVKGVNQSFVCPIKFYHMWRHFIGGSFPSEFKNFLTIQLDCLHKLLLAFHYHGLPKYVFTQYFSVDEIANALLEIGLPIENLYCVLQQEFRYRPSQIRMGIQSTGYLKSKKNMAFPNVLLQMAGLCYNDSFTHMIQDIFYRNKVFLNLSTEKHLEWYHTELVNRNKVFGDTEKQLKDYYGY